MITALLNHLWQSTAFVVGTGLLTLTLRNNAAQTRYWLWFVSSVKFLLPFSWLAAVGGHLVRPLPATPLIAPAALGTMQQVAQPFAAVPLATDLTAPAMVTVSMSIFTRTSVTAGLAALWLIGVVAMAAWWGVRWLRLRAILHAAVPLSVNAPLPVKSSNSVIEPGLIGIWRPVLLLPEGIDARLSREEMAAILSHELCHMKRRDNLTAAIHMLVEAAFWFYPLIWWLGARLIAERERACDEAVLAAGNAPEVYAESILKTCRFYIQSPLTCAAGVSGADLRKRVEEIMINRVLVRLNAGKKALLAVAAGITIGMPVLAGCVASQQAGVQQAPHSTAAQVTGRWVGEVLNPQYNRVDQIILDLNADGEKLTGAQTTPGFPAVAIHDGTVSGSTFSFLITRSTSQNGEVTLKNTGEVKGDELTLVRQVMSSQGSQGGTPPPLVLKRAPAGSTIASASVDDLMAQRRAEQARPRTAVAFNPKDFDKFTGNYQMDTERFFTITRRDDHFISRLTGQGDVEIFPESPTKFFAKVVPAQISFDTDAKGNVTELVVHQGGMEQHARRVDASLAKASEAALQKRIADGKPDPERQSLLQRWIVSEQSGTPDPNIAAPGLIAAEKQQWSTIQQINQRLGKFQTLAFLYVDQQGADVYSAKYDHGQMIYRVGPLSFDHKLWMLQGMP